MVASKPAVEKKKKKTKKKKKNRSMCLNGLVLRGSTLIHDQYFGMLCCFKRFMIRSYGVSEYLE